METKKIEEQPVKKRTFKKALTIGSAKAAGWEITDLIDMDKIEIEGMKKLPVKLTWDFLIRFANSMINEVEFYLSEDTLLSEALEVLGEALKSGFLG